MANPIQSQVQAPTIPQSCPDDMVHAVVDYQGQHVDLCVDQHEFTNGDSGRVAALVSDTFQLNQVDAQGQYARTIETGRNPQTLWQSVASQAPDSGRYVLKPNSKLPALQTKPGFDGANQPRINVSGNEAKAICEAQGKRLATPFEWEAIASQGGTKEYSTRSGELDVGVHYNIDGRYDESDHTRDVCAAAGKYIEYGGIELCDMSGNVWEWTYDPLTPKFSRGGGSWINGLPSFLRADSAYFDSYPDLYFGNIGLRCVAPPQDSTK